MTGKLTRRWMVVAFAVTGLGMLASGSRADGGATFSVGEAEPPGKISGVRIGSRFLPLDADPGAVLAAVERVNARHRNAFIDDRLNCRILDAARVSAFTAALQRIRAVPKLAWDGYADVAGTALPTAVTSPISAEAVSLIRGFKVAAVQSGTLSIRVACDWEADLAIRTAAEAHAMIAGYDAKVAGFGSASYSLDDMAALKRARFVMALTWLENAEAAASVRPGDMDLARDAASAGEAARLRAVDMTSDIGD